MQGSVAQVPDSGNVGVLTCDTPSATAAAAHAEAVCRVHVGGGPCAVTCTHRGVGLRRRAPDTRARGPLETSQEPLCGAQLLGARVGTLVRDLATGHPFSPWHSGSGGPCV